MENREGSSNNTSYFCWALSFFNGVIALGIASLALSTHIDFEHVIFQGLLPAIRVNVKSGRAYDKHVELVEGWQRDYAAQSVWEYCWTNMDLFRNARKDDMIPDASKTVINRDYEGFAQDGDSSPLVVWTLQSRNRHGVETRRGGDVYEVYIDGPSKIRPKVYDFLNGTYAVAFFAFDAGDYNSTVYLRWAACEGFPLCDDSRKYELNVVAKIHFSLQKPFHRCDAPDSLVNVIGTGRWIRNEYARAGMEESLNNSTWRWKPFESCSSKSEFPSSGQWPEDHVEDIMNRGSLRGKWVVFLGDSLSMNSFEALVDNVLPSIKGSESVINFRYQRYTEEEVSSDINRALISNFYYYPEWDLLLTADTFPTNHPVGGQWQTRFPLIKDGVGISRMRHVSLKWQSLLATMVQALKTRNDLPHLTRPDLIVFNFGLHFTGQLDPPLYQILLRHYLMTLFDQSRQQKIPILWRTTGMTHFLEPDLHERWLCRVPKRIDMQNEISNRMTEVLGIPRIPFDELSACRPDATLDNRHYLASNVRTTYNYLLIHYLNQTLTPTAKGLR